MGAVNDGISGPVRDPFPGITLPASTGATGSAGTRTSPPDSAVPDSQSGLPNVGIPASLSDQAGQAGSASPQQPGQTASSPISPGPEHGYGHTGAGEGHVMTNELERYPWQSPAGGT